MWTRPREHSYAQNERSIPIGRLQCDKLCMLSFGIGDVLSAKLYCL